MEQLTIGVVAVVCVIGGIFCYRYLKSKQGGKEEAQKFLNNLQEQMYLIAIEIINKIDITSFKNFEEYQKAILEAVYDGCWDFVDKEIQTADQSELLTALAKKFLTKENVEAFIRDMLKNKDIPDTLMNMYGAVEIERMQEQDLDKEINEKFSDESQYNENQEVDKNNLPPVEEKVLTDEEKQNINPQKDEDENYSSDDSSVEEVYDYILKKINKAGKAMYYLVNGETGKRKQISKQFVEESGLDIKEE